MHKSTLKLLLDFISATDRSHFRQLLQITMDDNLLQVIKNSHINFCKHSVNANNTYYDPTDCCMPILILSKKSLPLDNI